MASKGESAEKKFSYISSHPEWISSISQYIDPSLLRVAVYRAKIKFQSDTINLADESRLVYFRTKKFDIKKANVLPGVCGLVRFP